MNDYMVTVTLPGEFTDEFLAMIPSQRAHVNHLMQKGILTSYSLAKDRTLLWATFISNSREEVMRLVSEMPLYRYMEVEIRELAFSNMPVRALPAVSLN
jgi:muconolactone delta-isomerase